MFFVEIILTDSNLFFYLYAFLGNPQLLIITLVSLFDLVYPFFSTDSVWFTAKLMKVKIVKPKKKEHDNDGIVI